MTYEEGLTLLHKHVKNESLIKHCIAAGIIMRALAKKFNEDEENWELTGLLHDLDWEETQSTPEKHSLVAVEYLKQTDCPPEIIEAIRIHNHNHGLEPKTLLEKAIYCAEELTGLIVASALVQPDKKLASVKAESVLKKFKVPSFAKGVNREIILKCKEFLGIELEELIKIELVAMQARPAEVGL
ncbi:MAG: phosphohydrolase [Candidatus Colwellbacteria bacterium RIFCSPLOWO2_12_FULL_44_13]|uniref:Phosphohydrolase n=3 Tax=Candidatus Colwelliibacteriota TaxID=1817904 RepID=A0A1G1Z861_9BACT|nr:MAG: phosphohydrolase [Candidatus Colwellbacteria bacterium RIFCSPHIGHO2_12_FULL_44_17]OGY60246.1 MAG: phosphohydrolase [Candidatus Colwellbacteria bacterium RIFCSPLOWO2_02_FULL_44_20b]OGY62054.1 MAG: phosphohydrolase [Candidatus Colwellbacteria bacterium RIFCSPLOWO2_12_FULL_44_13]